MKLEREFIYEQLSGYPSCHGSTIAQRANGELLAAWFGGPHENHVDTVVLAGRKPDGAAEWQDVRPVMGMTVARPYGNAALYVERTAEGAETIWLFFIRSECRSGRGWCLDCMSYVTCSTDGGWSWSEPRLLRDQISFLIKNKPYRLRNGELAIPAYSDREDNSVLCTYDECTGEWSFHGPVPMPEGCKGIIQPALVQYPDGELQMFFRTSMGRIWTSRSGDDGRSWAPAAATELPNPGSGIDALALPDGRLLMVYNPTEKGRTPLCVGLSGDRGRSWRTMAVLEDEPGEYSYPAVILGSDSLVHITYTWRRERVRHVWFDPAGLG